MTREDHTPMTFPTLSTEDRLALLEPREGKLRMVLDTDTYNEIDDQFALVYALLSPERLDVEAIYAAPFENDRADNPAEGMEKSYEEILRLLDLLNLSPDGLVYKGSPAFLSPDLTPQDNAAVRDLIARARASSPSNPLYVVAIGAITNVASALLAAPEIIDRIVVVWLGGNALHWQHTWEFNLQQDVAGARVLFDSGVPLVHVPCDGVVTHLFTTLSELDTFVRGKSRVGDYLYEIYRDYHGSHYAVSKVIWDVATIAYLLDHTWVPTILAPSPLINDDMTWGEDKSRHKIRTGVFVYRDLIFRDLFDKLKAAGGA
jgi:hypothetical protein